MKSFHGGVTLEMLEKYAEGLATPHEEQRVRQALDADQECRRALKALQGEQAVLADALRSDVAAQASPIPAGLLPQGGSAQGRPATYSMWLPVAFAAAAALLVIVMTFKPDDDINRHRVDDRGMTPAGRPLEVSDVELLYDFAPGKDYIYRYRKDIEMVRTEEAGKKGEPQEVRDSFAISATLRLRIDHESIVIADNNQVVSQEVYRENSSNYWNNSGVGGNAPQRVARALQVICDDMELTRKANEGPRQTYSFNREGLASLEDNYSQFFYFTGKGDQIVPVEDNWQYENRLQNGSQYSDWGCNNSIPGASMRNELFQNKIDPEILILLERYFYKSVFTSMPALPAGKLADGQTWRSVVEVELGAGNNGLQDQATPSVLKRSVELQVKSVEYKELPQYERAQPMPGKRPVLTVAGADLPFTVQQAEGVADNWIQQAAADGGVVSGSWVLRFDAQSRLLLESRNECGIDYELETPYGKGGTKQYRYQFKSIESLDLIAVEVSPNRQTQSDNGDSGSAGQEQQDRTTEQSPLPK